ncbi:C-_U-editing enzyme APOBEC-1-like isoform X3 [Carettochelys insculpta]|uniref:C->U-editing enzyme APOBEC-1-like isoform X3 n=1 Tax=Carettochelys insculpta TaxID=44489 RepID=UPI003EBFEC1C
MNPEASHRGENECTISTYSARCTDKVGAGRIPISLPSHQWKISVEKFVKNYDPSVLPRVTCLLYEIKWNSTNRTWQRWICSANNTHAEIYFLHDISTKLRRNRFVHCSITCYMSWSPCGDCCREIMDFLEEMPNVNLVIYVARLYWHEDENNRQGLRELESSGVTIQIMDLPVYSYCWKTFVRDEEKDEDDYWPSHLAPWMTLYSLELQFILQSIPSSLNISMDENQSPIFSLCVDEELKRALMSANP